MKNVDVVLNRVIEPKEFYSKRFKPSLQTFAAFGKFFSTVYSDFKEKINVKSLEWNKDAFYIMLEETSSGEILHLTLKDNFGNKKCGGVLCTDHVCTGVHFEVQNESFLKFLVYFLVKGTSLKIDDFLKILTKDLKAKKEYYQIFWKSERPPVSIIQNWGHEIHKYRFLLHEGIMRNMDQSISLNLPEAHIHHSERECQGISPNNKDRGYHFFNFPSEYYNHKFDKYYYLTPEEKTLYLSGENAGRDMGISTDLDENDVVMGLGTDKLNEAINYVVKNIEERNIKVISFNCCCVPRIIGDDVHSVLKRAQEKLNIPFIFKGQLEKTPYEQKISLLEEYIEKINESEITIQKNTISLFGYHENIYQEDLGKTLKTFGIKINTSFIPSIDVRLLPLMFQSQLFVFSSNIFQKEAFEYPFQSLGKKYITPAYPFSFSYTDEWLENILREFNINFDPHNQEIKNLREEYFSRVEYVKSKEYTLGIFLVGKKDVEKFLDSNYMNNIDLAHFLKEMGFNLKFFVYDNFKGMSDSRNDDTYRVADGNHEEIIKMFNEKDKNLDITFYSSKEELDQIFLNTKLNLIYSDIYFDDRLAKLGIGQFNLKNFYVGYSGSLKTINGLINLCEMTFYKNYFKYFY